MSDTNRGLRNSVIHRGKFPTEMDCINFGNAVLDFIRPVIDKLKTNKDFKNELIRSVNYTGSYENMEIRSHYMPYQIFAINRPINKTENKSVVDFLKEQKQIKKRKL